MNKETIILSVDPGLTGAIAIYKNGRFTVRDIPNFVEKNGKKNKTRFNIPGFVDIVRKETEFKKLKTMDGSDVSVRQGKSNISIHGAVEKIHSMPGQGVSSMFSMGRASILPEAVFASLGIGYTLITPQQWKKELMYGMGKDKDAGRLRCLQMFPYLSDSLSRKKDHNRADAVLIGEYMRRQLGIP